MSEYGEEFEYLWKEGVASRSSGRKEAGYRVYVRTKKKYEAKIKEKDELLKEAAELLNRTSALLKPNTKGLIVKSQLSANDKFLEKLEEK